MTRRSARLDQRKQQREQIKLHFRNRKRSDVWDKMTKAATGDGIKKPGRNSGAQHRISKPNKFIYEKNNYRTDKGDPLNDEDDSDHSFIDDEDSDADDSSGSSPEANSRNSDRSESGSEQNAESPVLLSSQDSGELKLSAASKAKRSMHRISSGEEEESIDDEQPILLSGKRRKSVGQEASSHSESDDDNHFLSTSKELVTPYRSSRVENMRNKKDSRKRKLFSHYKEHRETKKCKRDDDAVVGDEKEKSENVFVDQRNEAEEDDDDEEEEVPNFEDFVDGKGIWKQTDQPVTITISDLVTQEWPNTKVLCVYGRILKSHMEQSFYRIQITGSGSECADILLPIDGERKLQYPQNLQLNRVVRACVTRSSGDQFDCKCYWTFPEGCSERSFNLASHDRHLGITPSGV